MNAFTHLYEVTYEPPGNWRQEAACRGLDPDLFHPEQGERVDAAKAVCATCPSIQPCAIYALSSPMLSGVWGGLSGEERVQARQTTGRMKVCLECRKPFHGPVKSSPFCGDECRRTVRLRSKAESHRNAKAVA